MSRFLRGFAVLVISQTILALAHAQTATVIPANEAASHVEWATVEGVVAKVLTRRATGGYRAPRGATGQRSSRGQFSVPDERRGLRVDGAYRIHGDLLYPNNEKGWSEVNPRIEQLASQTRQGVVDWLAC